MIIVVSCNSIVPRDKEVREVLRNEYRDRYVRPLMY